MMLIICKIAFLYKLYYKVVLSVFLLLSIICPNCFQQDIFFLLPFNRKELTCDVLFSKKHLQSCLLVLVLLLTWNFCFPISLKDLNHEELVDDSSTVIIKHYKSKNDVGTHISNLGFNST